MSKRFITLIIFLMILLIGGYFIYTKLMVKEEVAPLGIVKKPEIKFETEIFTDPKFLGLKQHIKLPIEVKTKGKINPFMKF